MDSKKILAQLNIFNQCKKSGLPFWQCPQLLFVTMGIVIIATEVAVFVLGARYVTDPFLISLIVIILTLILFVLTFIIVRSLERLAEANQLKSEFISIVSHQMRSPISNLKWSLEFLLSGKSGNITEKQEEYFKILEENIARMGELVSDLLMVSRIEQGKLLLHKTEFSLEDLTENIISKFGPYLTASNIQIKFEAQNSLPQVLADQSQVKSVIENLLDNAIRYIKEKGEVQICIKKRVRELLFEIKDTGVGIPKENQKHIFQKFFRSSNVMRYQTEGSGLGLYIAKFIIGRSGGKIGFQSQEGKGSTFWFTLPLQNH